MSPSPLEVPIFGPDSGPAAVLNGAGRLELNRAGSYDEGGLTPTLSELETLLSLLTALPSAPRPPIRVMIRPRGPPSSLRPDFIYTPSELLTMLRDIKDFASSGLLDPSKGDGFVLGVLRSISGPHGSGEKVGIDVLMNRMLMELVKGFDVPFVCVLHRAVDRVLRFAFAGDGDGSRKVGEVWKQVLEAGFDAVLTSGGPGNAMENIKGLREVLAAARAEKSAGNGNGRGVEVVVGGGVRRENVRKLVEGLGLGEEGRWKEMERDGVRVWFHSSCLKGDGIDEEEVRGLVEELGRFGIGNAEEGGKEGE